MFVSASAYGEPAQYAGAGAGAGAEVQRVLRRACERTELDASLSTRPPLRLGSRLLARARQPEITTLTQDQIVDHATDDELAGETIISKLRFVVYMLRYVS